MTASTALVLVAIVTQVPPPTTAGQVAEPLRREHRTILERESSQIAALASKREAAGQAAAASAARALLPPLASPSGATRLVPIREIEPEAPAAPADPAAAEVTAIRKVAAKALYELAVRAATAQPSRFLALADECLRGVVERQPDHAEARRLLGQVPFHGGWATPFAVEQIQAGKTLHPTYGWVPRSWVPHLERGELPIQAGRVAGQESWGRAEEADARHRDWANAWVISTQHFKIRTNVPLAEAISFGQRLERLHDVFQAVFADVIGPNLPLARRFQDPKLVGERPGEPHLVSYFADREEYRATLRPLEAGIDESIGFYHPPTSSRSKRASAYFFRDMENGIEVTATLYHEVSHQLLFESGVASPTAYTRNVGNFWVLEGLGTYFETLTLERDGSVTIGGLVGPRIEVARSVFQTRSSWVPFREFVGYGKSAFSSRGDIRKNYQQAMAMTTYLMQAERGKYRDDFLAYVKDVCQGRLGRTSAPTLEARLGVDYASLETKVLDYLRKPEGR